MGIFKTLFGLADFIQEADHTDQIREADPTAQRPRMIAPHSRRQLGWTSADRALSLSSVYRAVFIHQVTAIQLGIDVQRGKTTLEEVPALIRQPDIDETRDAFIEYTTGCLWMHGEAFWHRLRSDPSSRRPNEIVSLKPLNPTEVTVQRHPDTDRPVYRHRGVEIPERDISHLKLMRATDPLRGVGPIQAARLEIEGAIDARDYGAGWFTEGGMPSGILSTDQVLTPDQARAYKTIWNDDENGHGVRVLGQGLSYAPLLLKPADVQFLESQQFSITGIARLMGIPASLMLAAVEGQSRTYQNQIDEWRGYLRFTAMKALREIEVALTALLPGQQRVRFNLDAFLRTDTKSRYEAYAIGLNAGFLTPEEVRIQEGMPATPVHGNLAAPTQKEIPSEV